MQHLILASASPRRADILKQIGLQFIIRASDLDEGKFGQPMSPTDLVKSLALKKAWKVAGSIHEGLVIGADTIVVIEGEILGKPSSPAEAIAMPAESSLQRDEVHGSGEHLRKGATGASPRYNACGECRCYLRDRYRHRHPGRRPAENVPPLCPACFATAGNRPRDRPRTLPYPEARCRGIER